MLHSSYLVNLCTPKDGLREKSIVSTQAEVDVADAEGLVRTGGRGIVELGPDVEWDKGRAVGALQPPTDGRLVVYVGDGRDTAADYRLDDSGAVAAFLTWLAEATGPVEAGAAP